MVLVRFFVGILVNRSEKKKRTSLVHYSVEVCCTWICIHMNAFFCIYILPKQKKSEKNTTLNTKIHSKCLYLFIINGSTKVNSVTYCIKKCKTCIALYLDYLPEVNSKLLVWLSKSGLKSSINKSKTWHETWKQT